jgi:hypothetical protein
MNDGRTRLVTEARELVRLYVPRAFGEAND